MRLQIEVSDALADEIGVMQAEAEIATHREFFATLVALYRWAAMRSKDGKAIVALDEPTMKYNELTLPALETLKAKALAERALQNAGLSVALDEPVGPIKCPHCGCTNPPDHLKCDDCAADF